MSCRGHAKRRQPRSAALRNHTGRHMLVVLAAFMVTTDWPKLLGPTDGNGGALPRSQQPSVPSSAEAR